MPDRKNTIRALSGEICHIAAHLAAGYAAIALAGQPFTPLNLALAAIFSVAPDFDTLLGLAHRTVTHSLLAVGSIAVLSYFLAPTTLLVVIASYAAHLAVDLLHGNGIQLLAPHRRFYSIANAPPALVALAAIAVVLIWPRPQQPRHDWNVTEAALRAEKARLRARHECEASPGSYTCQIAELDARIALAEFCQIASEDARCH